MNIDAQIIDRFEKLIARGEDVLRTKKLSPDGLLAFDSAVDFQSGNQWLASAQSLLANGLGRDAEHYLLFTSIFEKGVTFFRVQKGLGVLAAAKEDYENGYLSEIRGLIAAEMLSDLLQQAGELLDAGYEGSGAVLAGAVLEDELRKLCKTRSITLPVKPKLEFMNAQLAKSGAYNKLTQKRLTAIADIRNSAAHGNWDEFTHADVSEMIKWITSFIERFSS